MKATLIIVTTAALLCACNKPVAQNESNAAADSATVPALERIPPAPVAPAPPPAPAQQPAAPVAAAEPATPAPAPELAPPGIFYLVEAARVETDSGVTGLPPGTGVKLLHDDLYQTPAGEAHLRPEQMTNDIALARKIVIADRNAQAALRSSLASQAKQAEAVTVALQGQQLATQTATNQAAATEARRDQIDSLKNEREAINSKLSLLYRKQNIETFRKAEGHTISSSTESEIKALIDRRAAIATEISRLNR